MQVYSVCVWERIVYMCRYICRYIVYVYGSVYDGFSVCR